MRRWCLVSVIPLFFSLFPVGARADVLVLVDPEPSWRAAVQTALEPWGVEVVTREGLAPGERASERGRAMVSEGVVVWVEVGPVGVNLWVYDAAADVALARALGAPPPFDAPTAAAHALSLKTLLRHGALDPAARPRPEVEPREREVDRGVREQEVSSSETAPTEAAWSLTAGLGARFFATAPDLAEPRLAVALTHWVEGARWLGLSARLIGGPGVSFGADDSLSGRYFDLTLELGLEARLDLGEGFDLGIGLALATRLAHLEVDGGGLDQPRADLRLQPSSRAEVSIGRWLTPDVRLALALELEVPLLRARYWLRGQPVLEIAAVAGSTSLRVEVPLR